MQAGPAAFMSYVRFNDQHDDGQLSQLRERLAAEVRAQSGQDFAIFQDRNDIAWGQNWQQRIDDTLDAVTLLLLIVTPSLFSSPPCRKEFHRFLNREKALGRTDLILPIYYISAREMDDPVVRQSDEMATVLASRQFADWRDLRFEPFTAPPVRKSLARLASRMHETLWPPVASPSPAGPARSAGTSTGSGDAATGTSGPATARTEPPTHVVDAFPGRGDFTTVDAAIKAAEPGDRILVRPGLYNESLVMDKPLEILGDGPVPDIEILARDTCVLWFRTTIGRVAHLTLRQAGGTGEWFGVDISQGRLDLEGCDISSHSLSAVGIHGGADPRLRSNKIHSGTQGGVLVYEGGLGTLEDNDITGNTLAGVEIRTGGNPTLRRNQINNGKEGGVLVADNGLGTLEDNDITGNTIAGVEIKTGGNPTLRRNQINNGKEGGVLVADNGLGTLEDNDITDNALAGVEIRTGGNPTLRRNQINDGREGGVFVADSGLGTLEDNDITGNARAGVEIKTGGSPTLRGNRITGNGGAGVWVYDDGGGDVTDNDLTGNTGGAWSVAKDYRANLTRERNRE